MTHRPGKSDVTSEEISILVLSLHSDMGADFVQTVCPDASSGSGRALIDGQHFNLDVFAGNPTDSPEWKSKIESADVVVLQVRFMDAVSLDRMKTMCKHLPAETPMPMAVFLLRESEEVDFKMSCSSCGQKLWVRDSDEGKRGRCPNCKKAFRLPAQAHHTKVELGLSDTVSVTRVIRGDPTSCRGALSNLKVHIGGKMFAMDNLVDPEILHRPTVRIEVQHETLPGVDPVGDEEI